MKKDILHSKIEGKGTPLFILHGFLGMLDNWKTLGGRFAEEGFEVHLIDQRNHGQSFWSDDFNYDLLSDDLKNYMDHYQIGSAIILGHSMGGKTAMQFACSHPSLTKKLIVADIGPKYYPPHHRSIIDGLMALTPEDLSSRSKADDALKKNITNFSTRQFLLKNLYWIEKGKLAFRINLKVLSEKMDEVGEDSIASEIYDGPTLFLKGDKSKYIVEGDLSEFKKNFPMAQLETINNAGHWLHAENPDQFFEKSMSFIKQ